MKIFLSSTINDLKDARDFCIEQIPIRCEGIEIKSYELDGHSIDAANEQEKCLALLSKCDAILILLDKYYGTKYLKNPEISITHAEVKKAIEEKMSVIAVTRDQTWFEFKVWKKNKPNKLNFDNVKDPKLFNILLDLWQNNYIHQVSSFTNLKDFEKIVDAINAKKDLIPNGAALPANLNPEKLPELIIASVPSLFQNGAIIRAEQFNQNITITV